MLNVVIFDGYVDEPTCLGVPPYISPYPRYIAGAVWGYDRHAHIQYITVDQVRREKNLLNQLAQADIVVVIAGMSVPGRYLSGFPVSPRELTEFFTGMDKPIKILVGPAAHHGFGLKGGQKTHDVNGLKAMFDLVVVGDGDLVLHDLLNAHLNIDNIDGGRCRVDSQQIQSSSVTGARIVSQHPFFPQYIIAEVETYRGCPRSIVGGCSFCSEPAKGPPLFRPAKDILDEIKALYQTGIRHLRIGSQPCIFSYMARDAEHEEFPQPNPDALESLFHGIRSVAPDVLTLHIDNANPGVLARFPRECREIAKTIIRYHTSGDVAALGVESVDSVVIKKNNLKVDADEAMQAIELLNEVGATQGKSGLPELLPGLNFVFGLDGESKETFTANFAFLQQVVDRGLLLRRINLRQVIPIPGTRMYEVGNRFVRKHHQHFQRFKRRVRNDIERPLLQRLVPQKTVLRQVFTEMYEGKLTFGRQLGSYPLLVGLPGVFPLHCFFDVMIVDYGFRSVTAIPFPLDINRVHAETLEAVPGVGRKRVVRLLLHRPFQTWDDVTKSLDDPGVAEILKEYGGFVSSIKV